jgi:hypothetical protein
MARQSVRLQVEGLDDRIVPAALGGGHAQVEYADGVITTPAADHTVEMPEQADAGLTRATEAPGR